MSVKVYCKLADCVNWDNGLCGAEEIRIDREGYCATYEEIPEEVTDALDLPTSSEDLNWEEDDDEDLEIEDLGDDEWEEQDEDEDEAEEDTERTIEDDPWSD